MLQKYDGIIQDQLSQGIVERVHSEPRGKEFYIPHKALIRETAESTKIRIVRYDVSARANEKAPSLNDCLETGPPLQNKQQTLEHTREKPVPTCGPSRGPEASFSASENPGGRQGRDAISLAQGPRHQTRLTRALFGLSTSPFLLGGVIDQHLKNLQNIYPREVEEIRRSLYVDDLISGDKTVAGAQHLKQTSQETMEKRPTTHQNGNQSYAKDQSGKQIGGE